MKRLVIFMVLFVLLTVCDKKTSEPVETTPKINSISYSLDLNHSSQGLISAENGGTVMAVDQYGVQYQINFPPHTVSNDTQITLIPLTSLAISGPEPTGCTNCSETNPLCCHRGIQIEPSGLLLDSALTLTIQFPEGEFPFSDQGVVVCLDASTTDYEVCRTGCNPTTRTLTAVIRHLSVFGTDDGRYDRLRAEVWDKTKKLQDLIGSEGLDFYWAADPLFDLHWMCTYFGFSDLVSDIEQILHTDMASHYTILKQRCMSSVTCSSVEDLRVHWNNLGDPTHYQSMSNSASFASMRENVLSDARSLMHSLAALGKALCDAGSCEEGREALKCVQDNINDFGLSQVEAELAANVARWFIECTEWSGTLKIRFSHEYQGNIYQAFFDSIHTEISFSFNNGVITGTFWGSHNVTVVPAAPWTVSSITAPDIDSAIVQGTVDSAYFDFIFIMPDPNLYPVIFTMVYDDLIVPVSAYGPLETAITYLHVRPHVPKQDGASVSGSGSENFGEPGPPIFYSYTITITSPGGG